jgi:hypothetical protein
MLPAPFCVIRYSCCCWLSCYFPRILVTVCLVPVFLKVCLRFGLRLFAARVVSVVLQVLYSSKGSCASTSCVLLCWVGGSVLLIIICNYHKSGISCGVVLVIVICVV